MTLHDRDSVRHELDDSVFAGQDLAKSMPKYKFPADESRAEDAFQVVSTSTSMSTVQAARSSRRSARRRSSGTSACRA